MTKEITKAIILQEMQDKLKLREFTPTPFLFDETVVPVYNIEKHLQIWRSTWIQKTILGTGGASLMSVPYDEKWHLRAYSVIFMTGTFTIAGVYVYRATRKDVNDFSYLDLTAAQNTSYLRTMPTIVTLEPGDALSVNVDGFTTTGDIRVHLDYRKEEIR